MADKVYQMSLGFVPLPVHQIDRIVDEVDYSAQTSL